jgi:hypothetical protein
MSVKDTFTEDRFWLWSEMLVVLDALILGLRT